jgi:hypothetical protein
MTEKVKIEGIEGQVFMKEAPPASPLEELNDVLVTAVIRPYRGEGEPMLILHETHTTEVLGETAYGHGRHWVLPLPPKVLQ